MLKREKSCFYEWTLSAFAWYVSCKEENKAFTASRKQRGITSWDICIVEQQRCNSEFSKTSSSVSRVPSLISAVIPSERFGNQSKCLLRNLKHRRNDVIVSSKRKLNCDLRTAKAINIFLRYAFTISYFSLRPRRDFFVATLKMIFRQHRPKLENVNLIYSHH